MSKPKWSRATYEMVARAIGRASMEVPPCENTNEIVRELGNEFVRDNPRFGRARFEQAVEDAARGYRVVNGHVYLTPKAPAKGR